MLNPDEQTVANLKALLKTTIAAVHGFIAHAQNHRLKLGLNHESVERALPRRFCSGADVRFRAAARDRRSRVRSRTRERRASLFSTGPSSRHSIRVFAMRPRFLADLFHTNQVALPARRRERTLYGRFAPRGLRGTRPRTKVRCRRRARLASPIPITIKRPGR